MTITKPELVKVHNARMLIYAFCSKAFLLPPEDELFEVIENDLPVIEVMAKQTENQYIRDGFEGMKSFLERRKNLDDADQAEYDLEALRNYTTLYCLADSVPMVESYYTSPEKLVMQESRDKMLALLRKYNLARAEHVNEFDDHISVELALMSVLASMSVDALKSGDMNKYHDVLLEQRDFHAEHFDAWIDEFTDKVLNYKLADGAFCKSIVKFTAGFIQEDNFILKELV